MLCSYVFLCSFKMQVMATVAQHEQCCYYFIISDLINSSNWQCFRTKALCLVPHRKHTKGNGQNSGGREALKSRGKGTRREALLVGGKIEWYRGQPPWTGVLIVSGGEAHIPQSLGTKGNQERWPSWAENGSGGTGGRHHGVDIFPDLSPRAKAQYGVKHCQGLHFPATTFFGSKAIDSHPRNLMKE